MPTLFARLSSAVCLALLAAAPLAVAQGSGEDPNEQGRDEGRLLGLRQGATQGRAQALFGEFLDGFEQGLAEAERATRRGDEAFEKGRAEGALRGRAAGLEAGALAAREAWALGDGQSSPTLPKAPAAPELAEGAGCPEARRVRLGLARGFTIDLDLDGLETRDHPLQVDNFEPEYPAEEDLRQRARNAGAIAEAISDWVREYEFAFQAAWQEAFEGERTGTPLGDRAELRTLGLEEGRREGERRLQCTTWAERRRAGFGQGWREGFGAGHRAGWDATSERHAARAVVLVRGARIEDASGDGLLEPGEGMRLRAELLNAGSREAVRSAGSWEALRGFEGEGWFEGALRAGERRAIDVDLGPASAEAPPGTSVVLRVRGLGSEAEALSARLGRPARIDDAAARLAVADGRLRAQLEVRVLSLSPASERARLRLESGTEAADVGSLRGDEAKTLRFEVDADLPEALGRPSTGVIVLRTEDGVPWHAVRWSAPFDLGEATALSAAPEAPDGLAQRLVAHLADSWEAVTTRAGRDAGLPAEITAFGEARAALPAEARGRLDRQVTAQLLERIQRSSAPKRLRRSAKEKLAG